MLDHQKLLAGDLSTTVLFLRVARQWARKFFRKRSQLDAVTQAAMLEMLDKLKAGDIPEPDRTLSWALTCANNAVRRELTRVRNHRTIVYESHQHSPNAAGASEWLRARDDLQRVNALLEDCDLDARRLLEAITRGHTYREIADEWGLGVGAARASVARLRKRLRAQLVAQDKRELLRQQIIDRTIVHQTTSRFESSSSTPARR
jgi:RNA polymerase sigma factor (sigma-70 family)